MRHTRRILRLWRLYASMDLVWITRGPRQFVMYFVSDLVMAVGAVTTTLLLAERFGGLGAWSRDQVLFMLGYATLARGLLEVLFAYNTYFISRRIGRGQLDHMLVQPQPLLVSLVTEGFMPFAGTAQWLPGLALLAWSAPRLGIQPTAGWGGLFVLNLVASSVVALSFSFVCGSLAFWAPRAAEEISSSAIGTIEGLKAFPLDGASGLLLGGLMTVVPIGLVAWYPCRALLGLDPAPGAALVTPIAAVAAATFAGWIFRRGLAHYARTGSSRYLSFGFRR